jgi:hypothetical protein
LSKRKPHFKTRKKKKQWKEEVPTGPETKNDCAGEDQQQFTGIDPEVTVHTMV